MVIARDTVTTQNDRTHICGARDVPHVRGRTLVEHIMCRDVGSLQGLQSWQGSTSTALLGWVGWWFGAARVLGAGGLGWGFGRGWCEAGFGFQGRLVGGGGSCCRALETKGSLAEGGCALD